MFERKPMLDDPALRWRTMPGLDAQFRGHPAPEYLWRRRCVSGPGPGYGEGFGGPIGGERSAQGIQEQPASTRARGIEDIYEGSDE